MKCFRSMKSFLSKSQLSESERSWVWTVREVHGLERSIACESNYRFFQFPFSSAGEKSDSSGSSGSESPNRGQNNAENRAQTWLGTLTGIETVNGRCSDLSHQDPQLLNFEGAGAGQEQENQYYYRSGFIKWLSFQKCFIHPVKEFLENGWLTYWGQQHLDSADADNGGQQIDKQDQIWTEFDI